MLLVIGVIVPWGSEVHWEENDTHPNWRGESNNKARLINCDIVAATRCPAFEEP